MKTLKNKVISLIGSVMFVLLIITILGSAFLFANHKGNDKSILGFRFYNVLTSSMTPTIQVGSMVLVKKVEPKELREGDIITYSASLDGSVVVTHRINRVIQTEEGLAFATKGDANQVEDLNPIPSVDVIGRVNLIIPYLGSIMAYSQQNLWLVIAGIIVLLLACELLACWISRRKRVGIS